MITEQINAALKKTKIKNELQNFIKSENYEYFITLTFIRRLSDKESIATVSHFIKRLIFLYPRSKRHLITGIIVSERTKRNVHFDGHLHFHIALKGINKNVLDANLWLSNAIFKCAAKLTSLSGKALCNSKSVDIKPIYEISRLASYLAKDIRYPFSALGDSIWPFNKNGVQYIMPKIADSN